MIARRADRERGAALLALLAVIALTASWFLVSQLNAESGSLAAARKNRNAEVLNRAKQALIGYVAAQAAKSGENNPGAMPCPENPGDFADATGRQGLVGTSCGTTTVGRFPWKTLGLDQLRDASGEPLWYVVGPGWGVASGSNTVINSNSTGQLTVDGVANDAIALIIAPGPAIAAPAATGCTAWNQARPTTGIPDSRNYLECENATGASFVTFKAPTVDPVTKTVTQVSNDQVIKITVEDVMPALEAAIAHRTEREIVPALKSVYASNAWATNLSAANPLFPYPATFSNPTTASYRGTAGLGAGLLPFFQTQGCTPATDPRCTTATTGGSAFLVFSKSGADTYTSLIDILNPLNIGWIRTQSTCSWTAQTYICTGEYSAFPIAVTLRLRVTNVAMGLRTFDASKISCTAVDDAGGGIPSQNIGCAATSVALQSDGSAIVTVTTNWTPSILLSGWGTYANYVISFDRAVFGDHALLDSSTSSSTGWFVRNEWYRSIYYAVAGGHTAAALPAAPACTTGANCLTVTNVSPTGAQRAFLILAGRSINGSARPSSTLGDYLEFGNATSAYERQTVSRVSDATLKRPFNDRVLVVDSN
jgi:hypothetical protein